MKSVNCNDLKIQYYKCLDKNLNADLSLLTQKTSQFIENQLSMKINDKVKSVCNSEELGKCLSKKYSMKKSKESEKSLIEYFSIQFDKDNK